MISDIIVHTIYKSIYKSYELPSDRLFALNGDDCRHCAKITKKQCLVVDKVDISLVLHVHAPHCNCSIHNGGSKGKNI